MNPQDYLQLGYQCYRHDDYQAAIQHYSHALALDPTFFLAFYHRAECYIALHEFQNALADLDHAALLIPDYAQTYRLMAFIHETMGNISTATHYIDITQQLTPSTYLKAGRTKQQSGDLAGALMEFNKGIHLFEVWSKLDIAWRALINSSYNASHAFYEDIPTRYGPDGGWVDIYFWRAQLHKTRGDLEAELYDLERFLEAGGTMDEDTAPIEQQIRALKQR